MGWTNFDYFCAMRFRIVIAILLAITFLPVEAYNDHRGHNLDSLERAVADWTPDKIDHASVGELVRLNRAYRNLMLGYNVLNGVKSEFYARKALAISRRERWYSASADAARYIGQHFYAKDQFDSALVYYNEALACLDSMASGAVSPTNPEGYPAREIDDNRSALYGAIGNLYNMMDSLDTAMDWYAKAGAIFDQYGWNESNSILYYNIGETWVDAGALNKAAQAYEKALSYAEQSRDSLMIVDVYKGFGRLYMEKGQTWKALPYLRKAEAYYAAHPDDMPNFRTENLEFMGLVLSRQKRQLAWLEGTEKVPIEVA